MFHPYLPIIVKALGKVWAWPLRFYYTKERLDSCLFLDVPSFGEPLTYYFRNQDARCFLNVYNVGPLDFEIDRVKVEVCLDGGTTFSCENTSPYLIKAMSHEKIHIVSKSPMTEDAARISKDAKRVWLNMDAYIIAPVRSFSIRRHIDDFKMAKVIV